MTEVACRMKSSSSGDDVMAASRQMTGPLRAGIAALGIPLALILAIPAAAAEVEAKVFSGADISRLITEKLAGQGLDGAPSIKAERLFPVCEDTPEIEPMFGGWNSVAVRCKAGSGWRFIIRTNLSSRAAPVPIRDFRPHADRKSGTDGTGIERAVAGVGAPQVVVDEIEVVALARSVSRNDMIGAADLVMVPVSQRNAMGAFFTPADVVGRRMKMGLGANQPVMARHLQPDYLVEEGNEVLISSYAGGISVDMVGYALENGQIGEWIGVENASSGKTVRGKITGEKKVRVIAKK